MSDILTTLAPSLPAQSKLELLQLATALKGIATSFQLDLVDGEFVTAVAWPFNTPTDVSIDLQSVSELGAWFELGIDCMIMNPVRYFDVFAQMNVRRVVIHVGSTDLAAALIKAHEYGFVCGLGITNDTAALELPSIVTEFDYVQVMGIADIGKQGEPFDERTVDTVHTLREKFTQLEIAVDGGVNAATIPRLKAAGANRFAPGSAIAKSPDPVVAFNELSALVGLQQG